MLNWEASGTSSGSPGPLLAPAPPSRPSRKTNGKIQVLIVEDRLMIADMTEDFLLRHGYGVCGIARTVDEAVALGLLHEPDIAILDLRLADGGLGTEIVPQLSLLSKLGVLYVTGNMSEVLLTADHGHACLNKPYRLDDLVQAIEIVADIVEGGATSRPLPRGFRLLEPAVAV